MAQDLKIIIIAGPNGAGNTLFELPELLDWSAP